MFSFKDIASGKITGLIQLRVWPEQYKPVRSQQEQFTGELLQLLELGIWDNRLVEALPLKQESVCGLTTIGVYPAIYIQFGG